MPKPRFPSILTLPVVVWRHRELLGSFVTRDLKARYEGSLLGRLWPILNPIILFAVYYVVFVVVIPQRFQIAGADPDDRSVAAFYIMSGLLPWIFFSESLARCTGVVLENGNLVKKIAFPSQLLPLYAISVNLIYFLIGLSIFIVIRLAVYGTMPDAFPALLVAVPLQIVFTAGLGLFLGAFNIFVRDTSQIIQLILQLWFFTTPIVYDASLISKNLPEQANLLKLNPLYHLLEIYRAALVVEHAEWPWPSILAFTLMTIIVFIPGHGFFLRTKGRFADEL